MLLFKKLYNDLTIFGDKCVAFLSTSKRGETLRGNPVKESCLFRAWQSKIPTGIISVKRMDFLIRESLSSHDTRDISQDT